MWGVRASLLSAGNLAILAKFDAPSREKFVHYLHGDLYGHFLQFSFRCFRKDRDGWETTSKLIGDRIRAARHKLGLTQCQVAERLTSLRGRLFLGG